MSYTHGRDFLTFLAATGEQIIATQSAAVKAVRHAGLHPIEVTGFFATVTTAMTVTPAVVEVNHRTAPGVTSGEDQIATLTLPVTGSSAGDVLYKKLDPPVKVNPGEELALELTTASTAGAAIFGLEYNELTENPANLSNLIESA